MEKDSIFRFLNDEIYQLKLALPSDEYILSGNFLTPQSIFTNGLREVTFTDCDVVVKADGERHYVTEVITGYKIPIGLIKRTIGTKTYVQGKLKVAENEQRRCYFVNRNGNVIPYFALAEQIRFKGGAKKLVGDKKSFGFLNDKGFQLDSITAKATLSFPFEYYDIHDNRDEYYQALDERFWNYQKRVDELLAQYHERQARFLDADKKASTLVKKR